MHFYGVFIFCFVQKGSMSLITSYVCNLLDEVCYTYNFVKVLKAFEWKALVTWKGLVTSTI